MGKRKYAQSEVSSQKTATLALPGLLVLDKGSDTDNYHCVHKRYFKNEKAICPACGSDKTRSSKVVQRKLKDIIRQADGTFKVVTVILNQRYLRCDHCKDSVFPEEIEVAEKGCKYTNRLSDVLADGTLQQSYNKVCKYYGVPASTASVGDIMRRRIKHRESQLLPFETSNSLSIIEVPFYSEVYPIVLAIHDGEVYCMDILADTSEEAYIAFFEKLCAEKIDIIYADPSESLRAAIDERFPAAMTVVTRECIERFARSAMLEVIKKDGKRFPIKNKNDKLVLFEEHIRDATTKKRIKEGFQSRPRLKLAYEEYQQLLRLLSQNCTYKVLAAWGENLPHELPEFSDLRDLIDLHETEIQAFLSERKPPDRYSTAVAGLCKAIEGMPNCIFDVLRARCLLTIEHDLKEENSDTLRLGIEAMRFSENVNSIAMNIREIKDPYSD